MKPKSAYDADRYAANRESALEKSRAYYLKNREAILARHKQKRLANPDQVRSNKLKSNYGISLSDKTRLWESQEKKCAICLDDIPRNAHLDHDHSTGVVRGILCGLCNIALGGFRDRPDLLQRAISYLERNKTNAS